MFWATLGHASLPANPHPVAQASPGQSGPSASRWHPTRPGRSSRPRLSQLHNGKAVSEVAANLGLTPKAVREIGRRYEDQGLERALHDQRRPGAAVTFDASQKQRIIAMVCSDPPEGCARWTVRLVAEEAVKRRLVRRVGRETVRVLLLHHDLKPWREKNVVRGLSQ